MELQNASTFPNKELSDLTTEDNPKGWRSAWTVGKFMKKNDPLVIPYIDQILEAIPHRNESHQRELLKIITKLELNDDQVGIAFNIAVSLWENLGKAPAVRYYSFKLLVKIGEKFPELKPEIKALANDQYIDSLTRGVKHSIIKITQTL